MKSCCFKQSPTTCNVRSDTKTRNTAEGRRTEPDYQRLWGREPAALALYRGYTNAPPTHPPPFSAPTHQTILVIIPPPHHPYLTPGHVTPTANTYTYPGADDGSADDTPGADDGSAEDGRGVTVGGTVSAGGYRRQQTEEASTTTSETNCSSTYTQTDRQTDSRGSSSSNSSSSSSNSNSNSRPSKASAPQRAGKSADVRETAETTKVTWAATTATKDQGRLRRRSAARGRERRATSARRRSKCATSRRVRCAAAVPSREKGHP